MRRLLGLGPSKAEQIADLEVRLKRESDTLDKMAFRHPRTYREARGLPEDTLEFRSGVAKLEFQRDLRAGIYTKANYDSETYFGLYTGP